MGEGDLDKLWPDFEAMWFNFPLPFKRGDIVSSTSFYGDVGHYVLSGDATLDPTREKDAKLLAAWERHGDCSDMVVSADGIRDDGIVSFHNHLDVLSLDYFDDPLEGHEKQLEILSRFEKEEISLAQCLKECREIQLAEWRATEKDQIEEARFMFGDGVPTALGDL